MKDHHDLYLKVDVLLLAYVFEFFYRRIYKFFWIRSCPLFMYFWLYLWCNENFFCIRLKLIWDTEKYHFIEGMIRGDISVISKGYAEANNKFLKSYDPSNSTSYVIYLDTNYLYGHCIVQLLPFEVLDWVEPGKFNLGNYSDNSSVECFSEVSLEYPDKLLDF